MLDEHIRPQVAKLLAERGMDVLAVAGSDLAGTGDAELLGLAAEEGRVFVTYDTGTVPASFAELFRAGAALPGLVLVKSATIPSRDISGLAKALGRLAARIESGEVDPSGGIFLEKSWPRPS